MMRPYLKYIIPLLIPMLVLMLPVTAFPFEGLTVIQQRVIAIFLLAALLWVFEPIPIYSTSVVIIVLEVLMCKRSPVPH
ncbi:transporter, putative [Vibrio cholerae]|nr:transporter, putative [Vibrio cholerae]